jgi:virginiamycin B lyase
VLEPSRGGIRAEYFAFLSFARGDTGAATSLGRYLEGFRVPIRLGRQLPKRMSPIFRERDEFAESSDLGATIYSALAKSGALIVMCSPAAARSRWVNQEIATFRRVSNPSRMFAVLLEGEPHDAFPPALVEGGVEPLAVDFRRGQESVHDARLRLVAALLNVNFDALKRREVLRVRKARLRDVGVASAVVLAACGAVVGFATDQPHLLQRFQVPQGISSLAFGSDGALWFAEGDQNIGRLTIRGAFAEYPVPIFIPPAAPGDVAAGPDDAMWFTEGRAKIGRITVSGSVTQYSVPDRAVPLSISTGADGALWFTQPNNNEIGRLTTRGHFTEYTLPTRDSEPTGIAEGPDGAIWFTEVHTDKIGRISIDGSIREYGLPGHAAAAALYTKAGPVAITASNDGALWFTQPFANKVGRITTTGQLSEYALPNANSQPGSILAGPDGALWFTEETRGIARITTRGQITEYPYLARGSLYIAARLGGELWLGTDSGVITRLAPGHWFFGR